MKDQLNDAVTLGFRFNMLGSLDRERVVNLIKGLAALQDLQEPALYASGKHNANKDTLARFGQCLMLEAAEFVNDTPWKTWVEYGDGDDQQPINRDGMIEELGDLLLYIGTWLALLTHFDISMHEVAIKAVEKNKAVYEKRGWPRNSIEFPIIEDSRVPEGRMVIKENKPAKPIEGSFDLGLPPYSNRKLSYDPNMTKQDLTNCARCGEFLSYCQCARPDHVRNVIEDVEL